MLQEGDHLEPVGKLKVKFGKGVEIMAYRYIKNIQAMNNQLLRNGIYHVVDNGAPTNGASGTGANFAAPGSFYTDLNNGNLYVNTGTKAAPAWTANV